MVRIALSRLHDAFQFTCYSPHQTMEGLLPIIRRKRRPLIPMQKAEGRMQNAESPDRLKPGHQTADRLKPAHRTSAEEGTRLQRRDAARWRHVKNASAADRRRSGGGPGAGSGPGLGCPPPDGVARGPTTIPTTAVVRQIETLSQLVTVRYVIEKVVVMEDVKWFGENRVLLVAHGVVNAGVNLEELAPDDLEVDGQRSPACAFPRHALSMPTSMSPRRRSLNAARGCCACSTRNWKPWPGKMP